jgi:hypothetical protein
MPPMHQRLIFGSLLVSAAFLLGPAHAEAALITRGNTIKHIGDAPDGSVTVGFRYRYWGIFWIDLWTWDGEYVVYEDKRVKQKLSPAEAAEILSVPESELATPFLYRFPLGLIILSGVGMLIVFGSIAEKRAKRKIQLLTEDPKYQHALAILAEHGRKEEAARAAGRTPAADNAGFEAAVTYLTNEGVVREEAERNLQQLLEAVGSSEGDKSL